MDFHTETIQAEESKILTTKRYKICRVIATGQIQNSYNKQFEVVEQLLKKVTKKQNETNTCILFKSSIRSENILENNMNFIQSK